MNHYVYRLSDERGNFYFGSRSCYCDPEQDKYMGSGVWPRMMKELGVPLDKTIVSRFRSRRLACDFEADIIATNIGLEACQNKSRTAAAPFLSKQWKNPWAPLLCDELLSCGPTAVCLWVYLVAMARGFGICTPVLARMNRVSEKECDDALSSLCGKIQPPLPRIYKDGNIWKVSPCS